MNSLEFIEQLIGKEESMIKTYEEYFKTDKTKFDKQITKGYIQIHQKNIVYLNQIKEELEIMELIKNGWSSMETTLVGDQIMKFQNLKIDNWVKLWNKLEKILLKKTLELKDE